MDLSKFSTADLQAMQSGDLTKVSTAGLQQMQAMHAQQATQQAAHDKAAADTAAWEKSVDPAAGMPWYEKALTGAGGALRKDYLAVRSLLPGGDLSDAEKQEMGDYAKSKENLGGWGTAGEVGAEALMALAPGGLATKGIQAGARAATSSALKQAMLRGAGEVAAGAGYGAATSLPGDRSMGAALGGAGSGVGQVLGRAVGGLAKPAIRPEAQALMNEGIQPTLGQAVGGFANTAEQKLGSLPVVGDVIGSARSRAVDEFNNAAIQKAAPGVAGIGDEAIGRARDAISAQYQNALGRMPANFTVDHTPIIQAAINAADDPARALSDPMKKRLLDYVDKNLLQRQTNITPEIAKRIESDMGAAVRQYASSSSAEDRVFADALREVQGQWRNSLTGIGNMAGNDAGTALRQADAAWRAFLPLDKAAASAGAQGAETTGRFTPKVLQRALRATDTSINDRDTRLITGSLNPASPYGQLNTLARNAAPVLSDTVADSGTTGRALMAGGLGAMLLNPMVIPKAALGYGAAKALYSRGGQRLLMEGASPQMQAILNALRAQGVPSAVVDRLATAPPEYLAAALRGSANVAANQ